MTAKRIADLIRRRHVLDMDAPSLRMPGLQMAQLASRSEGRAHDDAVRQHQPAAEVALCVDLDGTLVSTDLLWESVLRLLTRSPWVLLLLPVWLAKGKAVLKSRIAARVELDAASLPYRPEVVTWLRRERRPAGGAACW